MKEAFRLAHQVQVRKESWGLLFYSQDKHRLSFVRSGDWLQPQHFNGSYNIKNIIQEIAGRTGKSASSIENTVEKLTGNLVKNGMVVHELC